MLYRGSRREMKPNVGEARLSGRRGRLVWPEMAPRPISRAAWWYCKRGSEAIMVALDLLEVARESK